MRLISTLLLFGFSVSIATDSLAQPVSNESTNKTAQHVVKEPVKAPATEPTKETKPTTPNNAYFYYKVGAIKNTVLIVYVSHDFYELYIWEKEQLLQPVFEENQKEHPSINTIALKDAKSGKTVGTYSPKDGVLML